MMADAGRPKHTPEPWLMTHVRVIQRPTTIREHFAIRPDGGPTIAFLPEGRADIQEANARLIASAPEMLAMLRQEIDNFDDGIHGRRLRHSPMELNRAARALLARVEGETR